VLFLQEFVDDDDGITADMSSPTAYIQSREDSLPNAVNTGDSVVVSSTTAVTFDGIQPNSNVLISSSRNAVTCHSPAALAVDLTTGTSHELPSLDVATSR